jgi:hypothetical protein
MTVNDVLNVISEQLVAPILLVLLGSALVIAKSFIARIEASIIAKNDAEKIEKSFNTKSTIMKTIESIVSAAVSANMSEANDLKAANEDGKLTDEQSNYLQEKVRTLAMASLPTELFDESSSIYSLFGGKENIQNIVNAYIDSYVNVYKTPVATITTDESTDDGITIDEVSPEPETTETTDAE